MTSSETENIAVSVRVKLNDFARDGSFTMPEGFDSEKETNDVMKAGLAFMMNFLKHRAR